MQDLPIDHRQRAARTMLEVFSSMTGLPVALYEPHNGEMVPTTPEERDDYYEPYCRMVRSLPGGQELCVRDECRRAAETLRSGQEGLVLCHGGLYNEAIPIEVDGEIKAVLMYGETLLDDERSQQRSWEQHRRLLESLPLSAGERAELTRLFTAAKVSSPADLRKARDTLPVARWFYRMLGEEDALERNMERTTHELQTRLQALLANAENLYRRLVQASAIDHEIKQRGGDILNSAQALGTLIQNLTESLGEYRFDLRPILPLLYEARRIYAAEARRRVVEVVIEAPDEGSWPRLEISADHLQFVFNNLVQNAIKYSFRGAEDRKRYVRISGRAEGKAFGVTIENYGVGILQDEIDQGKLFEDGYQGELTHGEYRTGMGKGLFFSNRVVGRHHGRIEISSKQMGDADTPERQPHLNCFTVYLPYRQPKKEAAL